MTDEFLVGITYYDHDQLLDLVSKGIDSAPKIAKYQMGLKPYKKLRIKTTDYDQLRIYQILYKRYNKRLNSLAKHDYLVKLPKEKRSVAVRFAIKE